MYDLLIQDTSLISMAVPFAVQTHVDVAIQGSQIAAIAPTGFLSPAKKSISGKDQFLLPGLVNTHTHLGMSFFKGTAAAMELFKWLAWGWFYIERMTEEDIYWSAKLACLEMIRAGVTTFCDQYFYVDRIGKAVAESGLRACISEAIMEPAPGMDARMPVDDQIAYSRQVFQDWNGKADGRLRVFYAPHSLYACSASTVDKILDLAASTNTRLHIHLSETEKEVEGALHKWGMTPPQYMNKLGMFNVPIIAAHCVHLTGEDIELLDRPTFGIAHNPASNLKLQSGRAPIEKLVGRKLAVGLGSDGNGSNDVIDILKDAYLTAILHPWKEEQCPAQTVLAMATSEGARALGMEKEIGTVEVGKKADLILVSLNTPRTVPVYDPFYALVFTANGSDVQTTVVDGQVLMEDRKITLVNEEEILQEAKERAARVFSVPYGAIP